MTLLCPECFGDEGLKRRIIEIRPNFPNQKCDIHGSLKGIPVSAIAEIVDPVFRQNYDICETSPYRPDSGGEELWWAISNLTKCHFDDIADAITQELIHNEHVVSRDGYEAFYSEELEYEFFEYEDGHRSGLWSKFCESIVHERRFFNPKAKKLLFEIFDGIQFQRDSSRQSPVYAINPTDKQATLHRGRITRSQKQRLSIHANPRLELGAPPERRRKAGRMNPSGIATFYGAFDQDTCIAELRPIVGSVIVSAEFTLERQVYVLDTTRFEAPMKESSPFYLKHYDKLQQWRFMQSFMNKIAQPITPTDEHIDYIPTQAVAEFFLENDSFKIRGKSIKIEGIIYSSAQNPSGKNIVLLGEAAQVMPSDEEAEEIIESANNEPDWVFDEFTFDAHQSNPALKLKPDTDRAFKVSGASYEKQDYHGFDKLDF